MSLGSSNSLRVKSFIIKAMLRNTCVREYAWRRERGSPGMGRGPKQTHYPEKGFFTQKRWRPPPWQGAGSGRLATSRKKGRWAGVSEGACPQGAGAASEASLPLHQPHKLADVLGEQLWLLKGRKVAPTGHVGVGEEFRVLELHPLLWDVN